MRSHHLLIALILGPTVAGCRTVAPAEEPAPVVVSVAAPQPAPPASSDTQDVAPPAGDQVDLEVGATIFRKNCAACHKADGGGVIGPNLTDRCFKHGGRPMDIERIITQGVPEKGMVAWQSVLPADQIANVAGYVHSLGGQNVPGRPCEGELIER